MESNGLSLLGIATHLKGIFSLLFGSILAFCRILLKLWKNEVLEDAKALS